MKRRFGEQFVDGVSIGLDIKFDIILKADIMSVSWAQLKKKILGIFIATSSILLFLGISTVKNPQ